MILEKQVDLKKSLTLHSMHIKKSCIQINIYFKQVCGHMVTFKKIKNGS